MDDINRALQQAPSRAPIRSSNAALRLRLSGPLKGDYSLAVVNRHFASALLEAGCEVELEQHEGDLREDPLFVSSGLLSRLIPRDKEFTKSAVLSINDWPIRVPERGQPTVLHCFAWEESILPFELAGRLSRYNLVTTTANFVTQACLNSGVTSPVITIGNGTDHILRPGRDRDLRRPKDARPFRFLHVSSCFPRKGVDVLLDAYFAEFSGNDPVELVIKSFDNPHNQALRSTVARLQREHPHPPAIELNISSMHAEHYYQLYAEADCLVAPSYGEGFLLPAAEAILNDVPVITTRWGGQCDFCTDDTAWLIDARVEPSTSHVAAPGGLWARPDQQHLRSLMRSMTRLSVEDRASRLYRGQVLLEKRFTWRAAADRFLDAYRAVQAKPKGAQIKSGRAGNGGKRHVVISTFDQRCGIATFTRELLRSAQVNYNIAGIVTEVTDRTGITPAQFEQAVPVVPVWQRHSRYIPDIVNATLKLHPDNVLIQHHPGLYSWDMLGGIVAGLAGNTRTTLQFHAATEGIEDLRMAAAKLQNATRFIVHNPHDYVTVASLFGADRTSLIPHGIDDPRPIRTKPISGPIQFASFGFAAPHKGFHKAIEALAILRQAGYDVVYEVISALDPANNDGRNYLKYCLELARQLGVAEHVNIDTRFLPLKMVLNRLSRCAGGLMLYDNVNEGASGASRVMLRANVPLLVSDATLFADLRSIARVVGGSALALAREMKRLIDDPSLRTKQITHQMEFVRATQWSQVAKMVFQHVS